MVSKAGPRLDDKVLTVEFIIHRLLALHTEKRGYTFTLYIEISFVRTMAAVHSCQIYDF